MKASTAEGRWNEQNKIVCDPGWCVHILTERCSLTSRINEMATSKTSKTKQTKQTKLTFGIFPEVFNLENCHFVIFLPPPPGMRTFTPGKIIVGRGKVIIDRSKLSESCRRQATCFCFSVITTFHLELAMSKFAGDPYYNRYFE